MRSNFSEQGLEIIWIAMTCRVGSMWNGRGASLVKFSFIRDVIIWGITIIYIWNLEHEYQMGTSVINSNVEKYYKILDFIDFALDTKLCFIQVEVLSSSEHSNIDFALA